ncbi:hypothetical protein CCR85_13380 [Rhodothalassium salexigens]|uniref:MlaA family lipoprotein n=1 Tax=Rhodothalassium salexigens TaxID=1086 RepID=UPI001911649C|nr:VacJ family lipoprotein [Rhodothalassium salexigens]MBK5912479.1 hypothetical protein [Rhodothalassium salexigens]
MLHPLLKAVLLAGLCALAAGCAGSAGVPDATLTAGAGTREVRADAPDDRAVDADPATAQRAAPPAPDAPRAVPEAVPETAAPMGRTQDPWRGANRGLFVANRWIDRNLLDPVAGAYNTVLPELVRNRIANVFDLLTEPLNLAHNILQGEPERAGRVLGRIVLNATVGLGGMFDVASQNGVPEADEDFGQTLAVWGVPSGPYVVLPFFGPSTVRGAFGLGSDILLDPVQIGIDSRFGIRGADLRWVNTGLGIGNAIDTRARYDEQVDQIFAIDDIDRGYTLMRSGYLQSRCFAITNNALDAGCDPEGEDLFDQTLDEMRQRPNGLR